MPETDEDLAFEYLGCRVIERDGVTQFAYVSPGSERERACLQAIARLLRGVGDISTGLRWRLAALFDPETSIEARQLVMKRRAGGGANEPTEVRAVQVARMIAAEINANRKLEDALDLAEQRYGVSRRTAQRAWRDHGAVWIRKPADEIH
jgi:hypothetical protein